MNRILPLLIGLSKNIALLLSLTCIYSLIRPLSKQTRPGILALLTGALFGGIAIVGMLVAIQVEPGILIDGRLILVALAGLFGGVVSAVTAGALVSVYRLWLEGVGELPCVGAIFTAVALGAWLHWRGGARASYFGPRAFLLLGAALAASELLWTLTLPGADLAWRVLKRIALPVSLLYPLGTLFPAMLLSYERRRHAAEERLRESQARLAGIIGSAMDPIITIDGDQHIVLFNAAAEKTFGCVAQEAIAQPIDRFIPERFRNLHREHVRAFGQTNVTKRSMGTLGTIFGLRGNGEEFPIEASISQVDAGGQKLYTVILRDITERMRAETALRESEAYFRAVAESSIDAMVATDSTGGIIAWNKAAQRMFQYREEEVLGQPLTMIMPESYRETYQKGMERYQRTGIPHMIGTVVQLHGKKKDGSEFPLEVSVSSWETDRGQFYHGIIRDITERKRLEQELALRERSLSSFFTTAPAGLAILDSELRFLQINDTLAEMHGLPAEEHPGKTVRDVLPNLAPVVEPILQRVLATGEPAQNFEASGETPAQPGVLRHWVASYFPIVGPDGKPNRVGVVVVEVTKRKRAEQALQESAERLQTLSHRLLEVQESERRHIARELHDEMGQALTVLKINLQSVQQLPAGSAPGRPLAESISIVESLLQQVRNLSLDLRPSLLDDLGLAAALRWYVDRQAQRAGFVAHIVADPLETRLAPDLETVCFRVAQEALTNVVRHARARRVWVQLRPRAAELELVIRDDGVGFDVRAARARALRGGSLGLLGMEERVLLAGGRVEIESEPARGAEIRAYFPLRASLCPKEKDERSELR